MAAVDDGAADAPADFVSLYAAGYSRLAAQLYAYLGDATEAEDVAQEAYLRAWRSWPSISRYDDPVGWVRRVAWNLATSRLRRVSSLARLAARQLPPAAVHALGPDRVALVSALRQLPDRQRRAIVLHYLADLSVGDIAAELMAPRGTVLSWLHRGRTRLAELLGPDHSERRDDFDGGVS